MVTKLIKHENGKILEWKWASDNTSKPSPIFTSVYYIDGIFIDAGAPAGVNDFRNFITSLIETDKIKLCVLTHTHEDHCGGAYILQKEFNIPVYTHEIVIEKLRSEYSYPQYRQMAWGEKRLPVIADKVPDSRYVVFAGSSHMTPWDARDENLKVVREFLHCVDSLNNQ